MREQSANPITARLTRGIKWPTGRNMTILRINVFAIGLACGVASIISAFFEVELVVQVMLGIAILLALCYLPASFIAAAAVSARHARTEDYALLRLTNLTGEQIVTAYVDGMLLRLSLFQAVAMWFPVGVAFGASPLLYGMLLVPCLSIAALYLHLMSKPVVTVGVWLGFRRARHATLITGVAAAVAVALGAMLVLGYVVAGFSPGLIVCLAGALIAPVFRKVVEKFALADAVRCVDNQATLVDTVAHP